MIKIIDTESKVQIFEAARSLFATRVAADKYGTTQPNVARARRILSSPDAAELEAYVLDGRLSLSRAAALALEQQPHPPRGRPPSGSRPWNAHASPDTAKRPPAVPRKPFEGFGAPLRTRSREEIDPTFVGSDAAFHDKYGHVVPRTAIELARNRVHDWAAIFRAASRRPFKDLSDVDLAFAHAASRRDLNTLAEACAALEDLVSRARAILAAAERKPESNEASGESNEASGESNEANPTLF